MGRVRCGSSLLPGVCSSPCWGLFGLLGNGFRHTEERVRFSVTLLTERGSVFVIVADGGAGLADPETALRRGHGAGGRGSAGVGLDTVRRVAESAGGGVHIGGSRLGGLRVSVWFPAEQAAPPPHRPARGRLPVT
jgi:signal transduction histidine kinase